MFSVANEQGTSGDAAAHGREIEPPSLAWLLASAVGSALATLVIVGILAGRRGLPISPALLLGGAALGALPQSVALLRRRWVPELPVLTLALLAFMTIAGVGLWLAWPSLLPLGRSVDAVHQYQLVRWIAVEQRLPPLDGDTRGRLGEMIAYPPGLAFVIVAIAALVRQPPLETLYPTVALLGGLCAALLALLARAAAGIRGWQIVVPGLVGVWLLLAHRAYFLEAYIDHSYYAMVLGLVFVLLACAWPLCVPHRSIMNAFQLGLVLAALLGTYPLWLPIPALFALLACSGVRGQGTENRSRASERRMLPVSSKRHVTRSPGHLVTLSPCHLVTLSPALVLALLDLPARLATGQTVLEHQGVVTLPTFFNTLPLLLALPGALLLWLGNREQGTGDSWLSVVSLGNREQGTEDSWLSVVRRRSSALLLVTLLALVEMGALALAARSGLTATYHSYKMLFVLVPLAAALASAAAMRLPAIRSLWLRRGVWCVGLIGALASLPWALPVHVEQLPTANLVRAARWLEANDPASADHAVLVGAPAGPISYWLQVALLDQRRDHAEAAVHAFTTTPPTPEGWAVDAQLPQAAVVLNLAEAPPGSVVAARFGEAAVLRRAPFDMQAANPLIVRYSSFWNEARLKTEIELVRPVAGPLPLIELRLLHAGALVNTFPLQPNAERTKPQYLGADVMPDTLGGRGYINADAYPIFTPPVAAPLGSYTLMLRLSYAGATLDERLLATFDRFDQRSFANLAAHSGELDYLRRTPAAPDLHAADARFGDAVILNGWQQSPLQSGNVAATLRWNSSRLLQHSFATQVCAIDQAGRIAACSRGVPQAGFYPTWRWRTGEDVVERRELTLPPDLPAGTYTLVAGVFDQATQRELPLTRGVATLGTVVVGR